MHNLLLSLFIPIFCFSLSAMEIPVEKIKMLAVRQAAQIPSLKMHALKTYAQVLNDAVPKEDLSDEEMITWSEEWGVNYFFDRNLGDFLEKINISQLRCIPTDFSCPNVFMHDRDYGLLDKWEQKKQYIVQKNGAIISEELPVQFIMETERHGECPIFSPDGQWIVGWRKVKDSISKILIVIRCVPDAKNKLSITTVSEIQCNSSCADYAFYDEETIILRTATEIFMGVIADFAQTGMAALKKIYARSDGQKYPYPIFSRMIHILSDSLIACVGPDRRSVEILRRNQDIWHLDSTHAIQNIAIGHLVVNAVRGIAAVTIDAAHKSVWLYQLAGSEGGEKSRIDIEALEIDACAFSPNGKYLACGTGYTRSEIELFDCQNLTSPVRLATFKFKGNSAVCYLAWTKYGFFAADSGGEQHNIEPNYAAPLIQRYAEHRKKQEADAQQKPKKSNNNNA